jgi:hypothetical protein
VYTGQSQSRSLGLVLAHDKAAIEQAARETGFKVRVQDLPGSTHVRVWTSERPERDHGPFWDQVKELREAQVQIEEKR